MSRRVPEFALVIGVFLGLSAFVFGLALDWGLLATIVVAALGTYPFVAFGLLRDDDPTAVVPSRWILLAGALWASLGAVGALVADPSPSGLPLAALVGLALALPPVAYAVRERAGVNPLSGTQTLALAAVVAVALLAVGLLTDRAVLGVVDAGLVAVAAGLYATARGVRFDARARRGIAALGALTGAAVVALGVLFGGDLSAWLLVGATATLVPSLFVTLSRDR